MPHLSWLKSVVFLVAGAGMAFAVPDGRVDPERDPALSAVSWVQQAAERDALCVQAYRAARAQLDEAIGDPSWTAALEQAAQPGFSDLPPAIVVDVDETVLDNSAYNARLIARGEAYDPATWSRWVAERHAAAIPGAVAFLSAAAERGVTVFYVTNRDVGDEGATRDNLRAWGFPLLEGDDVDVVLTKGEDPQWGSDKGSRRAVVARQYRIVMMFGDDLGDFVSAVAADRTLQKGATAAAANQQGAELSTDRDARVAEHREWWGTRWFVLPNPMYGSWLGVLEARTGHEELVVSPGGGEPRPRWVPRLSDLLDRREPAAK